VNIDQPGDEYRPDPTASTQPMPVVVPPPVVAPPVGKPVPTKPIYVPAFGNLGGYALSRFAALVIDFFVVTFVFACFAFNLADHGVLAFAPRSASGFGAIAAIAFAGALVVAMLFEIVFETTIGKAFFGLGVRRGTGQHAGPQRIFIRYVLLPIDLIGIGEILALVTRRHQRLGDLLAGTVVARHRIGGFVTALAIVLFAALVYAQAMFGGGLTSALAVTAEGTYFGPTFFGGLPTTFWVKVNNPFASPNAQNTPGDEASSQPQ
jgi:uncharacterized RDD family membrane protein YckC